MKLGLLAVVSSLLVGCASVTVTERPATPAVSAPPPAITPIPVASATPRPAAWVTAGALPEPLSSEGAIWTHVIALGPGGALVLGSDNRCTPGPIVLGDSHSAALFDGQSWSRTGSLNKDRGAFVAVRLADGRVLVTGGGDALEAISSFSSTKLWDPATGAWRDGGLLRHARTGGFGTLLSDGSVLVGGGVYAVKGEVKGVLDSVERYNPRTDAWTDVARLPVPIEDATAVTLAGGEVVVLGHNDAEWQAALYDGKSWRAIEAVDGHAFPQLVALTDGGVFELDNGGAHRLNRQTLSWTTIASQRPTAGAKAVALADGRVFVAGGSGEGDSSAVRAHTRADIWDPASGTWTPTADMPSPRAHGDMALLADGSVLYAGGASADDFVDTPGCPTAVADAVRWVPGG
jgi:Kelch motif